VDEVARAVVAGERRIVVVDVEATCWKKGVFSRKKETIEIGAALLLGSQEPPEVADRLPVIAASHQVLTGDSGGDPTLRSPVNAEDEWGHRWW
jgi:hypothetical protein